MQFALGKKRIALSELHPEELTALLVEQLDYRHLDTRELSGFQELRELLRQRGDSPIDVDNEASLEASKFSVTPLDWKSHVVKVCRGALFNNTVYRRHESDEETADWDKFHTWGRQGYIARGTCGFLLLRRLPDALATEDLLVEAIHDYVKVPHENRFIIETVKVSPVPITRFCQHFGAQRADVARDLLWELASIYSRTLADFRSKVAIMETKSAEKAMMSNRVS
jgi:hypothetical protein